MLSKTFLASTTSNSVQSSWEDLGQCEEFDNIDYKEMCYVKRESKKPLRNIRLSQKLITEIRDIYTEYTDLFDKRLSNENDDDFNQAILKREEKLKDLSLKATNNLNELSNILNPNKNIFSTGQDEQKNQSLENNQPLIEESTLYDILISAEQINASIFNRYQKEAIQACSSKSSLEASPNTSNDHSFKPVALSNNLTLSPDILKKQSFIDRKNKNNVTYKARVTTYLTSLESTPQENNFEASKNNPFIPEFKDTTSYPNSPIERNKTAIFRSFQKTSPSLNSRYLSCESIDEKMVIIIQNNDQNDQKDESNDDNDESESSIDDLLKLNKT